ncbi:MAG: HAD hydrolase family protein [Coriobacteriia bacterium]|nr:HAD hydrolase family protein [Coriobacteriia bacterium]
MPEAIPFIDALPDLSSRLARAKVLYTDLDGTLLGRGASLLKDGSGQPCLDAATAVMELNRAGLKVVICSGRNARQLMEVSRMLGWDDFIAELGCVRSYGRGARRVYDIGVWPADATSDDETPYEAIVRVGALDLLRAAFPGLIEYHDPWHVDREVTHVLRGNVPVAEAQVLLDALPLPVSLVDNGIIHPPRHTLVGVEEVHAYHLVPFGVSKPRAILADLAERGITPDEAIAIGDSAADVAMADAVSLMVTVRNGLDDPVLAAHALARPEGAVASTRGSHGTGWRELAEAWLAATGHARA